MKTITMLFILGFSTNVFSQNLQISRSMEFGEHFFMEQDHGGLSNKEIWFAAHLAVEEIEDFIEKGTMSREQAEQAITIVYQVAKKMTNPGIVRVSKDMARSMLAGCIKGGFGGAGMGLAMGAGGVLAGGILGCFVGISVGILEH